MIGRGTRARLGAVVAILVAAGTAAGLGAPSEATPAPTALPTTTVAVRAEGTLLATAAEPGHPAQYAVRLAGGDVQPIRSGFTRRPVPNARISAVLTFSGRTADLAIRNGLAKRGTTVGARTSVGKAILRLARAQHATARAVSGRLAQGVTPHTSTPTTHHLYVMVPTNFGAATRTNAQVLASAQRVAAYWKRQANGKIADVVVDSTVHTYASSVTSGSSDCGFGSKFFNVVSEAFTKVPAADSAVDQVLVFVPASCDGLGLGEVGSSFATGGGAVVQESLDLDSTVAHEMGHNYGFEHANLLGVGEYYGIYDVMGFAVIKDNSDAGYDQTDALSTALREYQHATDVGEVTAVTPTVATPDANVTLAPRTATSGVRGAKVVDPDSGQTYYLDYRTGAGEDAGNCYADDECGPYFGEAVYGPGVTISQARTDLDHTQGIDFVHLPSGATSLAANQSWSTTSGQLSVSVTSADASTAHISIHYAVLPPFTTVGTPQIHGSPAYLDADGLTVTPGTWSPTPTSYTYEWYDGTELVGTDTTYNPYSDQIGHQVRVKVTASVAGRRTASAYSAPVTITAATLGFTAPPSISGTASPGSTVSETHATPDQEIYDDPLPIAYQWKVDGIAVPGANGATYAVRGVDAGRALTVTETWTPDGFTPASSTSAPVAISGTKIPSPTITGAPAVGQKLTALKDGWTVSAKTTWAYQWYAGATAISKATASTFTPTAAEVGKTMTVLVTAKSPGASPATLSSLPTAPVALGTLTGAIPKVKGSAKVGKKLTGKPGTWTSGTTRSYRWYAGGVAIDGTRGAKSKLTVTAAERGMPITFVVTGTKAGYTTLSQTSAPTAVVP